MAKKVRYSDVDGTPEEVKNEYSKKLTISG